MSAHVSDDLPGLLTGDCCQKETLGAGDHLRTCADCQQDLVSTAVAHSSLVSARRFARDVVTHNQNHEHENVGRLPAPDPMFDQVRFEAATSFRSRRRRRLVIAAAVAAVLAGGGATLLETRGLSGPAQPAAQTIRLAPVGARGAPASAIVSAGSMRIEASALPKLTENLQYEVWLFDGTRQHLRPVGYIDSERKADLPVSQAVISRYSVVAISVQKTEQVAFSGDIVARGSYD